MKKLIRSYSFWTALAGGLGVLASAIARAFSVKLEEKIITDIVMSFAGVLVAIGFVKMPSAKEEQEPSSQDEEDNKKEEG